MDAYVVRPLAPDQVVQAYSLVSILDPGVTQEQWSDYARRLIAMQGKRDSRNVITVQTAQRCIYGLAIYWTRPDLRRGHVLEIDNFTAIDIAGGRRVAQLLLTTLDSLARQLGCSCISISLLNPRMRAWLRDPENLRMDLFRTKGFQSEQLRLRKCFG